MKIAPTREFEPLSRARELPADVFLALEEGKHQLRQMDKCYLDLDIPGAFMPQNFNELICQRLDNENTRFMYTRVTWKNDSGQPTRNPLHPYGHDQFSGNALLEELTPANELFYSSKKTGDSFTVELFSFPKAAMANLPARIREESIKVQADVQKLTSGIEF
jgi:hypothetical protein